MSGLNNTVKAYSYLRFSTPRQASGDSSRRQKALAEEYSARHGLILDHTLTFQDLGMSAFHSKNSRVGALRGFLDAVERGLIAPGSTLLVESLDRLSRDQITFAQSLLLQLISASIIIVTLVDGRTYSKETVNEDPINLIFSIVAMIRANDESAMKSFRIKEDWKRRRALARTQPISSHCPFWLTLNHKTKKFQLLKPDATTVRRIFTEYISGKGTNTVATMLNQEGLARGKKLKTIHIWTQPEIYKLLNSKTVVGTLTCTTQVVENGIVKQRVCDEINGYYPSVISKQMFDAAQEQMMQRRRPRSPFSNRKKNVLSQMACCYSCGRRMYYAGRKTSKGVPYSYLSCAARARTLDDCCCVPYARYEYIEFAILTRTADIFRARENIIGIPRCRNDNTIQHIDKVLGNNVVSAGPMSGELADSFLAYEHHCKSKYIDLNKINFLLQKCFCSVVVDHPRNRLVLLWRDGVMGSVRDVWPSSHQQKSWRSKKPASMRKVLTGLSLHEAYGLRNGKRDARFPLLTLVPVWEMAWV